jgi:hypothetical protein
MVESGRVEDASVALVAAPGADALRHPKVLAGRGTDVEIAEARVEKKLAEFAAERLMGGRSPEIEPPPTAVRVAQDELGDGPRGQPVPGERGGDAPIERRAEGGERLEETSPPLTGVEDPIAASVGVVESTVPDEPPGGPGERLPIRKRDRVSGVRIVRGGISRRRERRARPA